MGIKGDKIKKASIEANSELLDALAVVVGVSSKKMFGGHGIFHESKMFGIVDSKGQFFLKVNESTKSEFVNKGGFQHSRMPYFSVPDDILNNNNELITWVTKSIEASKS